MKSPNHTIQSHVPKQTVAISYNNQLVEQIKHSNTVYFFA